MDHPIQERPQADPPDPRDILSAAAEGIANEHALIEADLALNRCKQADPLREREADRAARNEAALRIMLRSPA